MHCRSHIEWAYYGAKVVEPKDLCAHCAKQGAQQDKDLIKKFKTVLPVCDACITEKRSAPKRGPIKTAAANRGKK